MRLDELTEGQIRALDPGQDLDDLVATEVMGWHWKSETPYVWRGAAGFAGYRFAAGAFRPSTDIASAWRVLGIVMDGHDEAGLNSVSGRWECDLDFTGPENEFHVIDVKDTAPHAICVAALIAKKRGLLT